MSPLKRHFSSGIDSAPGDKHCDDLFLDDTAELPNAWAIQPIFMELRNDHQRNEPFQVPPWARLAATHATDPPFLLLTDKEVGWR